MQPYSHGSDQTVGRIIGTDRRPCLKEGEEEEEGLECQQQPQERPAHLDLKEDNGLKFCLRLSVLKLPEQVSNHSKRRARKLLLCPCCN